MPFIQVPPDSTGKQVDTVQPASSGHRQVVVVGSPTSSAGLAPVTSSGGIGVTILAGAGAGSTEVNLTNYSGAGAPVTSSGGLGVTIMAGSVVGSTSVNLTNYSGAGAPVTSSAGITTNITSGALTIVTGSTIAAAVTGTITIGGTVPIVSASSGYMQISGTPFFNLVGTSSAPAVVTSSGGLAVTIVAGAAAGSTAVNLTNYSGAGAPVTSSGGIGVTVLAGAATITSSSVVSIAVSGSSGANAVVTSSGGLAVTIIAGGAASATITSSAVVATYPSTGTVYTPFAFTASSSGSLIVITTSNHYVTGWNVGNQSSQQVAVLLYNSTGPTLGSTTDLLMQVPIPGSSIGSGSNMLLQQSVYFSGGIAIMIHDSFITTSTAVGLHSAGEVMGTLYYI